MTAKASEIQVQDDHLACSAQTRKSIFARAEVIQNAGASGSRSPCRVDFPNRSISANGRTGNTQQSHKGWPRYATDP